MLTCIGNGGHARALELPEDTVYVVASPADILAGLVEVVGSVIVGLGFVRRGGSKMRAEIVDALRLQFGSAVNFPSYTIDEGVCVDDMGRQVLRDVHVGPEVRLGKFATLNTGCIVEHDVSIGEYSHICPGAILLGGCEVGAHCVIGAGAIVLPGIKIADDTIIGAGAVVTKSVIESGATYVSGNPAHPIHQVPVYPSMPEGQC